MKSIEYEIGFSDSEVVSYSRDQDGFVVRLTAWNEIEIELHFDDALAVFDRDVGDVSDFCKMDESSDFLVTTLAHLYAGEVPQDHGYQHYCLINNDDVPALDVIAHNVKIRKK